jgi:Phage gp6-like head-tail connector protein
MSAVSVSELKAQLNLDDYRDEGLLQLKIDAAEAYVSSFIGSPILVAMPVVPDEDGTLPPPRYAPVPATIMQAVLMLAAYWYEVREAAVTGGNPYIIPFGVHELLQAHRRWVV